jgi:hypothetical protein
MLVPCWQVRFAAGSKLTLMKAAARQIEVLRQGRGFAVESARPELQQHRVLLQWHKSCGYNSAIAWVNRAMKESFLEWELCLPAGVVSQTRDSGVDSASEPRTSGRDAPSQAAGSLGVSPIVVGASGSVPLVALAPLTFPTVNPAKAWLPIKALEMRRGSPLAPSAVEMSEYELGDKVWAGWLSQQVPLVGSWGLLRFVSILWVHNARLGGRLRCAQDVGACCRLWDYDGHRKETWDSGLYPHNLSFKWACRAGTPETRPAREHSGITRFLGRALQLHEWLHVAAHWSHPCYIAPHLTTSRS